MSNTEERLPNLFILAGPTAVGKTDLSLEVAKRLNGEIISADSAQIYKFMDIGTAKLTKEEMQGIPHHLIDVVYPDESFSVAEFAAKADNCIRDINSKGKLPIVTGGTGLYINSLLNNLDFTESVGNETFREEMSLLAEEKGNAFLHEMLREIDPPAYAKLHVNDVRRVIRALEVFKFTGKPISFYQEESKKAPPKYNYTYICLTMDREKLYQRIDTRVDIMMEKGLVKEVEGLLNKGYHKDLVSMQALGYKEVIAYLEGSISLDEAIRIIKRDSRHYAKRQLTWFRRDPRITWINVDEYQDREIIVEKIILNIAGKIILL